LQTHWELLQVEKELMRHRGGRQSQVGHAVPLKFFQKEGWFPLHRNEIPTESITYLAQQLKMPADEYRIYNWGGRSIKRHRATIHAFLKFHETTAQDVKDLTLWLCEKIVPQ
jgi:Domain of unknown function (DUF4158)